MKMVEKIPSTLGGIYVAWWVLIYFYADHAWRPIFLIFPLFPLGFLIEGANNIIYNSLNPALNSEHLLADRIAGLNYLLCGFVWFFLIGCVIRHIVKKIRFHRQLQ